MKFKLKNGEVVRLENTTAGGNIKTKATSWVSGVTSITSVNMHYVLFEFTPEMMEMFKIGIKTMAINTIPEVYIYGGDECEDFGKEILNDFENLKGELDDSNRERKR